MMKTKRFLPTEPGLVHLHLFPMSESGNRAVGAAHPFFLPPFPWMFPWMSGCGSKIAVRYTQQRGSNALSSLPWGSGLAPQSHRAFLGVVLKLCGSRYIYLPTVLKSGLDDWIKSSQTKFKTTVRFLESSQGTKTTGQQVI